MPKIAAAVLYSIALCLSLTCSLVFADYETDRQVYELVSAGSAKIKAQQYDQAVISLRQAIKLKPTDWNAHFDLAIALARLDLDQDAVSEYSKAYDLNQSSRLTLISLARAFERTKNMDQAVVFYKRFVAKYPGDREIQDAKLHLGWCDYKKQKAARKVTVLESTRAWVTYSSDPEQSVSADAVEAVLGGLSRLPEAIRDGLFLDGYRVLMVPKLIDAMPELADQSKHPRGWSSESTWQNVNGTFDQQKKLIIVAETARNREGRWVSMDDLDTTCCHEFGHAYDHYLGQAAGYTRRDFLGAVERPHTVPASYPRFSHSARFSDAYDQDLKKLNEQERKKLAYFVQPNHAGAEELFAELFPLLYDGPFPPGSAENMMRRAFPAVLAVMSTPQSLEPHHVHDEDERYSLIKPAKPAD